MRLVRARPLRRLDKARGAPSGIRLRRVPALSLMSRSASTWTVTVATAVLLTSPAEGFARVLVEAASQGTAAVSTASAGPRDVVINGVTGFLHEVEDVAALADSVCVLLREPARAAMMGAQARTLVSVKFNPQRLRSAWVNLWVTTARQAASA